MSSRANIPPGSNCEAIRRGPPLPELLTKRKLAHFFSHTELTTQPPGCNEHIPPTPLSGLANYACSALHSSCIAIK